MNLRRRPAIERDQNGRRKDVNCLPAGVGVVGANAKFEVARDSRRLDSNRQFGRVRRSLHWQNRITLLGGWGTFESHGQGNPLRDYAMNGQANVERLAAGHAKGQRLRRQYLNSRLRWRHATAKGDRQSKQRCLGRGRIQIDQAAGARQSQKRGQ